MIQHYLKKYLRLINCHARTNQSSRLYMPKHTVKVHVWAGISMRGRTGICNFDGIMNAKAYVTILSETFLPFLHEIYPDGHRLMQDNDPKHTSTSNPVFWIGGSELVGNPTRKPRSKSHWKLMPRPKIVSTPWNKTNDKGWTCEGYNNISGKCEHSKVCQIHQTPSQSDPESHRRGRWSYWVLKFPWVWR